METLVRLLGPVAAELDGRRVDVGHAQQRAVLAVLAVEVGTPVTAEELIDRVWGETAPRRARDTVYSYMSRLRAISAGEKPWIVREGGGYVLNLDPSAVDMHRFGQLAQAARSSANRQAAELWTEAFALWRGDPFTDMDMPWLDAVARRLHAERAEAEADRMDVRLRLGEHGQLTPELTVLAEQNPLDERTTAQLMLALYRCGRQAEALEAYTRLRNGLVDQLGSEPGAQVRELHRGILAGDDALLAVPSSKESHRRQESQTETVPRVTGHVPQDVTDFVGRDEDLRQLDMLLDVDSGAGSGTTAVVAGAGGSGKTALAVRWAHSPRAMAAFPDGCLYVNLQGFSGQEPVSANEALGQLLWQLGVPGNQVPAGGDQARALCRRTLEGRRVLVILDNAVDAAQVRPLLATESPCLTLITSRDRLDGLAAREGAQRVFLDRLPAPEGAELARTLLDPKAVADDPEAVSKLAKACAQLPLAIRVAAAGFASAHPNTSLSEYVAELHQDRLGMLDAGGDEATAVTTVLAQSTARLRPEAMRMLCLLAVHPGPRLDVDTAAAVSDVAVPRARRLLRELCVANVLEQTDGTRYGMHDLLREHARDEAGRHDVDVAVAQSRLLQHYADQLSNDADVDWVRAELPALTACLQLSAVAGFGRYAMRLGDRLEMHGHSVPACEAYQAARGVFDSGSAEYLEATRGLGYSGASVGDPAVRAHLEEALRGFERLGDTHAAAKTIRAQAEHCRSLGELHSAARHNVRALELFREGGDREGEADTLSAVALDLHSAGKFAEAAEAGSESARIARETANVLIEAEARVSLGMTARSTGELAAARTQYQMGLELFRRIEDLEGQLRALHGIGQVAVLSGEPGEAITSFREALALSRELGDRRNEGFALHGLGEAALAAGDARQAQDSFAQAKRLCELVDDAVGEVFTSVGIAEAMLASGQAQAAADTCQSALDIVARCPTPLGEARARRGLGRALAALGRESEARHELVQAMQWCRQHGHHDAELVQKDLDALDSASN